MSGYSLPALPDCFQKFLEERDLQDLGPLLHHLTGGHLDTLDLLESNDLRNHGVDPEKSAKLMESLPAFVGTLETGPPCPDCGYVSLLKCGDTP